MWATTPSCQRSRPAAPSAWWAATAATLPPSCPRSGASNDWEKTASLFLRLGRTDAIDAYDWHGRITGGDRETLLDAIYRAWKADVDAGRSSLMIAPDAATVSELNRRTRLERVSTGAMAEERRDRRRRPDRRRG